MKALILTAILAITLVSCNQKNKETENNTTETSANSSELYACPMHPEVQGKKDETCSKCGMELTEPVAQKEHDHTDGTHDHTDAATSEEGAELLAPLSLLLSGEHAPNTNAEKANTVIPTINFLVFILYPPFSF